MHGHQPGLLAQTWSLRSPSCGLPDILMPVQARECMLDTEAFTRLGLSEHNLVRPSRQVRPSGFGCGCVMSGC
jgi:hypothetical protein